LPFHRVEEWTGSFFKSKPLWEAGVKIYLGHGGNPCKAKTRQNPIFTGTTTGSNDGRGGCMDGREGRFTGSTGSIGGSFDGTGGRETGMGGRFPRSNEESPDSDIEMPDATRTPDYSISDVPQLSRADAWTPDQGTSDVPPFSRAASVEDAPEEEPEVPDDPEVLPGEEPHDGDQGVWEDFEEEWPNCSERQRSVPLRDEHGNKFVMVVDVTGIHHLPVVHCQCSERRDIEFQFLEQRLFPASFKDVRTVFTFNLLDDFRLSNLECKTSGYQYYQKLRRLTSSAFPRFAPNRYRELLRVSRQYRNLRTMQVHGYCHEPEDPGLGGLAMFCSSCPQPGVNLPDNWKEDPNR
jgi:CxC2 like cysteine cluster associated with KDZ transposases